MSLNLGIQVAERALKRPRQLSPNRGFPCSWWADKTDYCVHTVPALEVVMDIGTEVVRPLGDVNFKVNVPEATLSKEYVMVAALTSVVLGTGEPPLTLAVMPVVAVTETVVPAAMGLSRPAAADAVEYVLASPTRIRSDPLRGMLKSAPSPTK